MLTLTDNPAAVLALLPLGFLVGSIPFGPILGRLHGVDLRKVGSGNVGATNVGRVLGRKWGYLCFLLDMAKGLATVLLAGGLMGLWGRTPGAAEQAVWVGAGCAAVVGHVFSPWLGFRGGKGVSTALGVVLGIWPYFTTAGLVGAATWVVVIVVTRYVSLGSMTAGVAFLGSFAALNWDRLGDLWPMVLFAAAIVALIILRHRSNIRRLLAGTENRIGRRPRA
jgi:glycerol-3-phosphate acyltransferase PlsY